MPRRFVLPLLACLLAGPWLVARNPAAAQVAPPPNDDFAAAATAGRINQLPFSSEQDAAAATAAADDPSCVLDDGSVLRPAHTIWYAYRVPTRTRGWATVDTSDSSVATILGVYTGARDALMQVVCDDDGHPWQPAWSQMGFLVAAGEIYYFMVGTRTDSDAASLRFNLVLGPENDEAVNATEIDALPASMTGDTTDATCFRDPSDACNIFGHPVWHRYTAKALDLVVADTFGSGGNRILFVYRQAGNSGGSPVAVPDPEPVAEAFDLDGYKPGVGPPPEDSFAVFETTVGATYYFVVASIDAPGGTVVLDVRVERTPLVIRNVTIVENEPNAFVRGRRLYYGPNGYGRYTPTADVEDFETGIAEAFADCDPGFDDRAPYKWTCYFDWPSASPMGEVNVWAANGLGWGADVMYWVLLEELTPEVSVSDPKPDRDTPFIREGRTVRINAAEPGRDWFWNSGLAELEVRYCRVRAGATCRWVDARPIGRDDAAPYAVRWNHQPADRTYQLLTRAVDNVGNVGWAPPVTVRVANGGRTAAVNE